jgi:nitrate/nitrite transporter NarK
VARYFRATTLEVFGFSNAQLGDAFAVYGVTAMLAYFAGGPIADRYSARKLMTFSLIATSVGGLYMASIPGPTGMPLLFGYWGVTTILFFWAAMIRSTREWGGVSSQGRAFGILDGGRGLIAAGFASIAVVVFGLFFPAGADLVTAGERLTALRSVIYFYTALTFVAGLLCWIMIPDPRPGDLVRAKPLEGVTQVLRTRSIWVQALVVICAYCGYKGLDNYSLYAVQVLGMNEYEAAKFTATAAYLRPVGGITAGLLADRFSARRVIAGLFLTLSIAYGVLAQSAPSPDFVNVIYANLLISFFAVYALRGIYFALLEETGVPSYRTGTAVGVISVVGYTPDVFYAPIAGRLLDHAPGIAGHQHVFWLLTSIAIAGVVATLILFALTKRSSQSTTDDPASALS